MDIRYFHLASHWDELNWFPWTIDSFITTIESVRHIEWVQSTEQEEDLFHWWVPTYLIGMILYVNIDIEI